MSNNEQIIDKRMMYFTVLDILFLPYFFVVSITYSFVAVIWWYQKRKPIIRSTNRDYNIFVYMCVLMIISALIGIILLPAAAKNNIVLTLQFIVSFMHFYVFKYYFDNYSFPLKKYLVIFSVFAALLAIVFTINTDIYFQIRHIWSPVQSTSDEEFMTGIIRYGFLWMDENNIAYIINAIMLFVICNERSALYEKIIVVICALLVDVCSMSRGGMLTFYTGLAMYGLLYISRRTEKRRTPKTKMIVNVLLCAVVVVGVARMAPSFINNEVTENSMERLEDRESDNRTAIYKKMLNEASFIEYSLVGHGNYITLGGRAIKPHSLHFYWVFAYGMVSYFMMLYIMFRKRKITKLSEYIWIWPYFFGCSINIIIGEEKAMCIGFLLLAACSSPRYLMERRDS